MKSYQSFQESQKELSVGTIIVDNDSILLGHATMQRYWDIFKGHKNQGESNIETAVRELREESGLTYYKSQFEPLGLFPYIPKKDLYLFKIFDENLKDKSLSSLRCTSYFDYNGRNIPEMDRYKVVHFDEIIHYCSKNMVILLRKILQF